MTASKVLCIALTIVAVSGCIPWPHFKNDTPEVKGSISHDGVPLKSTLLLLVSGKNSSTCEGETSTTKTDENGAFAFSPHKSFKLFIVVMGHCFNEWSLCSQTNEGWKPLLKVNDYVLCDSGPFWTTTLKCDVTLEDKHKCKVTEGYSRQE